MLVFCAIFVSKLHSALESELLILLGCPGYIFFSPLSILQLDFIKTNKMILLFIFYKQG